MKVTPADLIITAKKLLLISSLIQITILIVYFAQTGNTSVLNLFRVLRIDLFFPQILAIPSIDIIAFLTLIIVFLIMLFFNVRRKNSNS